MSGRACNARTGTVADLSAQREAARLAGIDGSDSDSSGRGGRRQVDRDGGGQDSDHPAAADSEEEAGPAVTDSPAGHGGAGQVHTYKYLVIHADTHTYIQIHADTYTYIQIHADTHTYLQSSKLDRMYVVPLPPDSSRGPRHHSACAIVRASQARAVPCSTSTRGPWSGPMTTRPLPLET